MLQVAGVPAANMAEDSRGIGQVDIPNHRELDRDINAYRVIVIVVKYLLFHVQIITPKSKDAR